MKIININFIVGFLLINYIICRLLVVVIYALPRRLSICKHFKYSMPGDPILAYKNIIVIITSLIAIIIFLRFEISLKSFLGLLLLYCLCVISFIDYDFKIIPDSLNLCIFILSIIFIIYKVFNKNDIVNNLWGFGLAVAIGIIMVLISTLLKKELIGGGDLKLFISISLIMGWSQLLLGILLASLISLIVYSILFIINKRINDTQIPFGPYLSIGFMISFLFGSNLIDLYLQIII